ncbi:aminotransferase class I/II-fold pyridoxal phosphate-dependent enzyme [Streptomyces sp. XM4011]|uniref:aminotransferase class I/II-fold pyridoxal phosphate-dependent enzyme n=1 Tax=Streptomyces TaxID=1883 RepID=UPI001FF9BE66|nr:aminotransferase class I/II-fold pyridoxal phosphate-dependent enzyme [Streptomyces sp. XM4011]MCK1813209.1 aminotransferase class I/II-fold pyridoxal phosphate-dependent enzyme [Streptomyces sp. XM4011]
MRHRISPHITDAQASYQRHLGGYLQHSPYREQVGRPGVVDLAFGDPHEFPSPDLVSLLQNGLEPRHPEWFAYLRDHQPAQSAIARSLSVDPGMPFMPEDVALTNGAFAGLMVCLRTLAAPGEEVIHLAPSWFYYEPMIASVGAVPVQVALRPGSWRPDVDRIAAALTPATSVVVINSPNNPTGVVYSDDELRDLAAALRRASERHGRPIYVVSDESYRKIVFERARCPSMAEHYPYTLLVHTYTKTLMLPGERVGYVALPPTMPDREPLRRALDVAQLMTGWAYPNNSLLYALPDLERLAPRLGPLRARRDRLVTALRDLDYAVQPCEGTFYLLVAAPDGDDWGHAATLAEHGVLVLPGSVMGAPGYFRVALTATDAMLSTAVARLPLAKTAAQPQPDPALGPPAASTRRAP